MLTLYFLSIFVCFTELTILYKEQVLYYKKNGSYGGGYD